MLFMDSMYEILTSEHRNKHTNDELSQFCFAQGVHLLEIAINKQKRILSYFLHCLISKHSVHQTNDNQLRVV